MGSESGIDQPKSGRRLAAIMFTDMVGYSALTQTNESLALELIETQARILEPIVALHGGRIVRSMGDGLFVEFASALAACRSAIQSQEAIRNHNERAPLPQRFQIRIGIHVGDVEVRGADLFGDGVNIASRIEPLAEPGGICITEDVASQIRNKLDVGLSDLGLQNLKNIASPVRTHMMVLATSTAATSERSIAVLPFANLSPDPDNEFFSDGLTDEMIFSLARIQELRVVSRTSSFAVKGSQKPLAEVARAVGADYLLEGSVRRAGSRIRVTAQLVDVAGDRRIWGERFDRELQDIFEIQDEITESIVKSLEIALSTTRAGAPTQSTEAYDAFLRGQAIRQTHDRPHEAEGHFRRAIELDPNFARAHSALAMALVFRYEFFGTGHADLNEAEVAARRAVELDPTAADSYIALAEVIAARGEFAAADNLFEQAIAHDPRSFDAHYLRGHAAKAGGNFASAIEHLSKAALLRPDDYAPFGLLVNAYERVGQPDEAKRIAREALARMERRLAIHPTDVRAWYDGACSLMRVGEQERAFQWCAEAIRLGPENAAAYYGLATVHCLSGEPLKAIEAMETAVDKGLRSADYVEHDPDLASIIDDPRMVSLLARMRTG